MIVASGSEVDVYFSNTPSFFDLVTLGDTSPLSPSLASLGGHLYLAWKGDGNNNLNVMESADNGFIFGDKYTSPETSPQAPCICADNSNLYIAWSGVGNAELNVAQVVVSGSQITGFSNKVTLSDTSQLSPTLASLNGRLYIGWKGDGNDNLNVMYSSDNGRTFGNKYTSGGNKYAGSVPLCPKRQPLRRLEGRRQRQPQRGPGRRFRQSDHGLLKQGDLGRHQPLKPSARLAQWPALHRLEGRRQR